MGATWFPMGLYALPLPPNNHTTAAQGSPGLSGVTLKSLFFSQPMPA